MNSATYFIPEVRMYELVAFFVLASYASLYLVIKYGDKRSFILFVVSTLGAAYTHYYSMMAVGLFYMGPFFYYVFRRDWKCSDIT